MAVLAHDLGGGGIGSGGCGLHPGSGGAGAWPGHEGAAGQTLERDRDFRPEPGPRDGGRDAGAGVDGVPRPSRRRLQPPARTGARRADDPRHGGDRQSGTGPHRAQQHQPGLRGGRAAHRPDPAAGARHAGIAGSQNPPRGAGGTGTPPRRATGETAPRRDAGDAYPALPRLRADRARPPGAEGEGRAVCGAFQSGLRDPARSARRHRVA